MSSGEWSRPRIKEEIDRGERKEDAARAGDQDGGRGGLGHRHEVGGGGDGIVGPGGLHPSSSQQPPAQHPQQQHASPQHHTGHAPGPGPSPNSRGGYPGHPPGPPGHPPPTGYYQTVYPPSGDPGANAYPPPHGRYDAPYMPPPPHSMPPYGYPMYPPYQPMYPPHYPPPPHHGVPPPGYYHSPVHQGEGPPQSQPPGAPPQQQQMQPDGRYDQGGVGGSGNSHPPAAPHPSMPVPAPPPPLPPEGMDPGGPDQKPPARGSEINKDGSMEMPPGAPAPSRPGPPTGPPMSHHPHHAHPHGPHPPPQHPPPPYATGPPAGVPGGNSGVKSEDDSDSQIVPGAITARLKTYIKPRIPSTQEVLDRRSRKNAQSRARAAKLRQRISEIETKAESERTEEEMVLYQQYESRRQRKNDRSRERALEKKEEIDRILAKPEKKRTKIEKQFLETALMAKKRKNEGDRLRRQRLKDLGLSTKGASGVKPGISARGPLPPRYQATLAAQQTAKHFGDIPMSPLPTVPPPHHSMVQSPGAYASPGMMTNIAFPSPGQPRGGRPGRSGSHGGGMETPRGGGTGGSHDLSRGREQQLPFIPPSQTYDNQASPPHGGSRGPPGGPPNHMSHMSQHSSRVEQRRNPDGSMSISIGGRSNNTGGPSFGGEGRGGLQSSADQEPSSVNISDVSHLLLYSDNGEGEDHHHTDPGRGGHHHHGSEDHKTD